MTLLPFELYADSEIDLHLAGLQAAEVIFRERTHADRRARKAHWAGSLAECTKAPYCRNGKNARWQSGLYGASRVVNK